MRAKGRQCRLVSSSSFGYSVVKVQVDPVGVTKGLISEHWEWVWTALLVPLAGWGWRVYRGRKGRNNAGG